MAINPDVLRANLPPVPHTSGALNLKPLAELGSNIIDSIVEGKDEKEEQELMERVGGMNPDEVSLSDRYKLAKTNPNVYRALVAEQERLGQSRQKRINASLSKHGVFASLIRGEEVSKLQRAQAQLLQERNPELFATSMEAAGKQVAEEDYQKTVQEIFQSANQAGEISPEQALFIARNVPGGMEAITRQTEATNQMRADNAFNYVIDSGAFYAVNKGNATPAQQAAYNKALSLNPKAMKEFVEFNKELEGYSEAEKKAVGQDASLLISIAVQEMAGLPREDRPAVLAQVYSKLKQIDPESAEAWKRYTDPMITKAENDLTIVTRSDLLQLNLLGQSLGGEQLNSQELLSNMVAMTALDSGDVLNAMSSLQSGMPFQATYDPIFKTPRNQGIVPAGQIPLSEINQQLGDQGLAQPGPEPDAGIPAEVQNAVREVTAGLGYEAAEQKAADAPDRSSNLIYPKKKKDVQVAQPKQEPAPTAEAKEKPSEEFNTPEKRKARVKQGMEWLVTNVKSITNDKEAYDALMLLLEGKAEVRMSADGYELVNKE